MTMEYLIVVLASALAGIGTGLVGLSAATAMVPILIVLCPAFTGEHGAYMATAIALASDIPGSAVTAAVYAKNRRIDLERGWLLFVCIVGMCTAGSIAAFFTHQTVLGSFSLFLCTAIGIRFLVKPSSGEQEPDGGGNEKKRGLSPKEIAVSLFFGLTIGFGTGFFGSGGGMMMLIVFTAMLGYERRTAVGTSTFIMTFTALIAAVSHILMEPALVWERWDFLLLAMVVSTAFSLISARFANRVNQTAVGYTTGGILLVLGLSMLLLQYRAALPGWFWAVFKLFFIYVGFILLLASLLLIVRFTTKVPDYIFRKLLHVVAFTSILPLAFASGSWKHSAAVQLIFLVFVILALLWFERYDFYKKLFVEKGRHEVVTSFILLFGLIALLLAFFWGFHESKSPLFAVAAIFAWGPGDAAAAIVGRNFGRHKLRGRFIEGTKSLEGFLAMAVTAFLCSLLTLTLGGIPLTEALLLALILAPIEAAVELFSKHGLDTVTCPIAAAIVLALLA